MNKWINSGRGRTKRTPWPPPHTNSSLHTHKFINQPINQLINQCQWTQSHIELVCRGVAGQGALFAVQLEYISLTKRIVIKTTKKQNIRKISKHLQKWELECSYRGKGRRPRRCGCRPTRARPRPRLARCAHSMPAQNTTCCMSKVLAINKRAP